MSTAEISDRKLKCGVYSITNLVNGKRYVGSSIDIEKRWRDHKRAMKLDSCKLTKFVRAWRKYGEENFKFEILSLCPRKFRLFWEGAYQRYYKTVEEGYNCKYENGDGSWIVSEETKRKIGDSNKGKIKTAETREKLSKALKGKPVSEQTRLGLLASRGKKRKPLTESHKLALSRSKKGKKRKPLTAAHRLAVSLSLKGIPKNRPSPNRKCPPDDLIRKERDAGLTPKEISEKYSCNRHAVNASLRRTTEFRHFSDETRKKMSKPKRFCPSSTIIEVDFERGESVDDIAVKYDIDLKTAIRAKKRFLLKKNSDCDN